MIDEDGEGSRSHEISREGPRLIYTQVADSLAARIERGEMAPGSRLPPERELAAEYGVTYMTIRRATRELRRREIIVTVHGRGTFVAE